MEKGILNKKISRVHFIGVGGISTSALASYLLSKGFIVSGSDNVKSNLTKNLEDIVWNSWLKKLTEGKRKVFY